MSPSWAFRARRLAALCMAIPACCMGTGMNLAMWAALCWFRELMPRRCSAMSAAWSSSPLFILTSNWLMVLR